MDNYKIKVKDEAESKEAQELFVQLGYSNGQSKRFGFVYTQNGEIGCDSMEHWDYYNDLCQELTLPQLRDLVVLKRNDVKDANYTYAGNPVLKLETQDYKVWDEAKQAWLEHIGSQTDLRRGLKAIPKAEKDPALISGADALRALADGKEVEYLEVSGKWRDAKFLTANVLLVGDFSIRLKPQTIKLELELPKPFEPKVGDLYWCIAMTNLRGYTQKVYKDDGDDECLIHLGAYRTEDEIKQVVEQLRKIRGTNS
ncbi:hypothetical protein [Acinetobacter baumannii]|uniref:hypothetical protein n=1 Tax=Acinetobacter baumannii TaxID=470 RepID=UPI0012ED2911|nr:hypothetical protein [Acinetobacter baumannii]MVM70809.1 hypothetical protein [Acinetobacter baumannii]